MDRKIRVLVITYPFWREDDNLGNSYSNIFKGMDDKIEFAHVYCKDNMPQNQLCHKYFHISEHDLIKSVVTRKKVGRAMYIEDPMATPNASYSSAYNKARSMRWEIFLMARDFLASWGRWKTEELDKFITDFRPDLIFGSLSYIPIVNKMMVYVSKKFNVPLVPYPWDDFYSLKRKSYSLTYWFRFLIERQYIKRTARQSTYLYTITKQMKDEYEEYFGRECRLLYKGHTFDGEAPKKAFTKYPIKMVYMGNVGGGRWKVLAKLAQVIKEINNEGQKMVLDVYTISPRTDEMRSKLNIENACRLMNPVAQSETMDVMSNADILVHVEPTSLKEMYFYRLSFSTKLVDYFFNAKCVLAIGGKTASMAYLRDNDAGIVEINPKMFASTLKRIADNPKLIEEYAMKAWACGKKNHRIEDIQERIYNDFLQFVK